MPLGQGWLNAWVKVNSKHVVFPPNNKTEWDSRDNSHKDDATHHNNAAKSSNQNTGNSVATAPTAVSEDPENQAIRRFNTRKHKRRLQRTVSASDLLRDKANKGKKPGVSNVEEEELQASVAASPSTPAMNVHPEVAETDEVENRVHAAQHIDEEKSHISAETDDSLRFVAGFFGADIESYSSGHGDAVSMRASQKHKKHKKHILRSHSDAMSLQYGDRRDSRLDEASVISRSCQSEAPPRPYHHSSPKSRALARSESIDSQHSTRSQGGGMAIRFPQNLFAGDNSKGNCRSCRQMHNELLASQEDLEYLRGMALRNEYICSSCQSQPTKHGQTPNSSGEGSIHDSTRILNELTARHKEEIEKLNKERARWQQDTNMKLQKFASLCKDLDEEAALRNDEAISLYHELDVVRGERDEMATEMEKLRARVSFFEKREAEQRRSDLLLRQLEDKGLDGADKAIRTRDSIIVDLSDRLERALDCLELEREQQRQRRQIIFPVARASVDGKNGEEMETELRNVKVALRDSQAAMAALQIGAEKKEVQWMVRLEQLERQLEAARS